MIYFVLINFYFLLPLFEISIDIDVDNSIDRNDVNVIASIFFNIFFYILILKYLSILFYLINNEIFFIFFITTKVY